MKSFFALLVLPALCFSMTLLHTSNHSDVKKNCLGPPYLYVVFHGGNGGHNNFHRFTRDGKCVLKNVLVGGEPLELRKLQIGADGTLYQNEANKDASQITHWDVCNKDGYRSYLGVLVDGINNPELIHPYGLSLDNSTNEIYATTQNTFKVLRFDSQTGTPLGLHGDKNGVFANLTADDLRGMEHGYVGGVLNLFVADKQKGVLIYSATGTLLEVINVTNAVGLKFITTTTDNKLYIGSSTDDAVYEYSFASKKLTRKFTSSSLDHPAGVTVFEDTLFVLNQKGKTLQTYNLTTGKFIDDILSKSDLPDVVESIILSWC